MTWPAIKLFHSETPAMLRHNHGHVYAQEHKNQQFQNGPCLQDTKDAPRDELSVRRTAVLEVEVMITIGTSA